MFQRSYAQDMETTEEWAALEAPDGPRFPWQKDSLFIQPSPFPKLGPALDPDRPLRGARALLVLGDSITTDHISPNGAIRPDSQAGRALASADADPAKSGKYGARRGNPAICLRGMFDNPLLRNELVPECRGNLAWSPDGGLVSVLEAAEAYRAAGTSLVIVAGRNYGAGSSRDWAAKGLRLLGVQTVVAESFERIRRANLVGMGVLPIVLPLGTTRHDLAIGLRDMIDIALPEGLTVRAPVSLSVRHQDGSTAVVAASLAVTSESEIEMIREGGILPAFLNRTQAA